MKRGCKKKINIKKVKQEIKWQQEKRIKKREFFQEREGATK